MNFDNLSTDNLISLVDRNLLSDQEAREPLLKHLIGENEQVVGLTATVEKHTEAAWWLSNKVEGVYDALLQQVNHGTLTEASIAEFVRVLGGALADFGEAVDVNVPDLRDLFPEDQA